MADTTNEYYLRKWQIVVSDKSGNALDVSELRCTFTIEKKINQSCNYADISIYNLDAQTEQAIIKEGSRVIVSAGYQDGAFGVIFDGEVFQPLFEKESNVDYKLSLHCIDGDSILNSNFIKVTRASGYKYTDIITEMSNSARTKIPIGAVTSNLKSTSSPRGKVLFGDPRRIFRNIAKDNNATFFIDGGKLHLTKITDTPESQALVISPATGLVGTPQQTDEGFAFRCLLNPMLHIVSGNNTQMSVKLDNSVVRQEKAMVGRQISMLDQNMIGKVIAVTYTGDTRGNDWYCDVLCTGSGGKVPPGLLQ